MSVQSDVNREVDLFFIGLPQKEEKAAQVKNCIENYTKSEGLWGSLVYLIKRVWNAFKSLFGYSDWQVSKRILQEAVMEKIKAKEMIQKFSLDEKLKQKIDRVLESTTAFCLDKFLTVCIEANSKKGLQVNTLNLSKKMLTDLQNTLKDISEEINKTIPTIPILSNPAAQKA